MSVKDDVSVSGTCVVLKVLNNPRLARIYKPEEVGELIEALAEAAEKALDNRHAPMSSINNPFSLTGKNDQ